MFYFTCLSSDSFPTIKQQCRNNVNVLLIIAVNIIPKIYIFYLLTFFCNLKKIKYLYSISCVTSTFFIFLFQMGSVHIHVSTYPVIFVFMSTLLFLPFFCVFLLFFYLFKILSNPCVSTVICFSLNLELTHTRRGSHIGCR